MRGNVQIWSVSHNCIHIYFVLIFFFVCKGQFILKHIVWISLEYLLTLDFWCWLSWNFRLLLQKKWTKIWTCNKMQFFTDAVSSTFADGTFISINVSEKNFWWTMCVKSFFVKITMVLLYITLFCGNVEIKFMKSKSEYFVISIDWPKHLEREVTLIYALPHWKQ